MTDDLLEEQSATVPPGFSTMNWFEGFGRLIGPLHERVEGDGSYVRAFRVGEHHTNGMGNCHGGMLMAFADMAFGHCVSLAEPERYWVTVRLLTDFVSGARKGDFVEGTGRIAGRDGQLFTVEGRIWVGTRTVMTGQGIFKALGERQRRR